jgi:hypothetical protein
MDTCIVLFSICLNYRCLLSTPEFFDFFLLISLLSLPCRPDGGGGEGGGGAEGGGGGAGHLHPPRQAHVRHCRRVGVRYESLVADTAAAVAAAAAAAAVAAAAIHLATVISCSTESTGTFPSSFLFGGHGNLFFPGC